MHVDESPTPSLDVLLAMHRLTIFRSIYPFAACSAQCLGRVRLVIPLEFRDPPLDFRESAYT